MKALRTAFGEALVEFSTSIPNLVVISCDLQSATGIKPFFEKFPEKSIEVGISEANGVGIAAGLALSGFKPVLTSFGSFLTGKNTEIRISIGYNSANVVLVGTHGGLIGPDGATQSGIQDLAVMRSIPGIKVFQPSSPIEVREILKYALESDFPSYIRISRNEVPEIHSKNFEFEEGMLYEIKPGNEVAVFSSGPILHNCLRAAEELVGEINVKVVNVPTIKPIKIQSLQNVLHKVKLGISFEDHLKTAGLGSALLEKISEANCNLNFAVEGLDDEFVDSGSPSELESHYKLDSESIKNRIRELWKEFV